MKIGIVTVTYNSSLFIDDFFSSIEKQDFLKWDLSKYKHFQIMNKEEGKRIIFIGNPPFILIEGFFSQTVKLNADVIPSINALNVNKI